MRTARAETGLPDASLRRALFAYQLGSSRAGLLCGHYRYARWMGERWASGATGGEWAFVTVLRDPVERWLSHYFYNRANPGPFHIEKPLEAFLETSQAALLGSVQLRHLADVGEDDESLTARGGRDRAGPGDGVEGGRTHPVRRAIANLERFAIVGRLEDLNAFNDAFEAHFGRRLEIPRRNVNRERREREEVAGRPQVMERIRDLCAPDRALHEAVSEREPAPTRSTTDEAHCG